MIRDVLAEVWATHDHPLAWLGLNLFAFVMLLASLFALILIIGALMEVPK